VILAHLVDLHLGFRAYERAVGGRNVRAGDVADAFLRAVEEIVRVSPDVILIAGDLFDRLDPPPAALVTLTRGLASVRKALPATPVLITAGPRDLPPRSEEPGVLGAIDTLPGVAVAMDTPRSVRVGDLAVALLPHGAPGAEAVPDEVLDALDPEDRLHAVDVLAELADALGQVVVVTGTDVVERRPEAFA